MKLSRISRIIKLLAVLQSGKRFSLSELTQETGVCRRTIFRDLNVLEEIGIPFSFDGDSGGYGIDPEFFLPSLDFNLQEALALLMLVHEGVKHLPLPYRNSALLAGMKIENNLPDRMQKYCNATLANVSIRPNSHAPMESLDQMFRLLQQACHQRRKVEIEYKSHSGKSGGATIICPYHIYYNNRAWYVVARSSRHGELRTFKLNRIKRLAVLDKLFEADKNFDIADYFGKAWSMIPEGRLYNVLLRFSPKVAASVCEVQWHSTQEVTHNEDGSVDVEFRVDGLGEIKWWVLGYGDQVEVIRPAALRKMIKTMAEGMVKKNE